MAVNSVPSSSGGSGRASSYVASAGFLLLAVAINQWTVAWLLNRRLPEISLITRQNIAVFDGLLVLLAFAWPWRAPIVRWWTTKVWPVLRPWVVPGIPVGVGLALLILMLPSLAVTSFGLDREDIPLWHPVAVLFSAETALLSALLMLAVYWSVLRLSRRRWIAAVALLPWAALYGVDLSAIWAAGLRFEPQMLGWSSTNSIAGLATPKVAGLAFAPLLLGLLALGQLRTLPVNAPWRSLYRLWLGVAILGLLQPSYLCYRVLSAPVPVRYLLRAHSIWADAEKYRSDPVVHSLVAAVVQPPYRVVDQLSPQEQARAKEIGIAPARSAAQPPPSPYRRVIFLSCVSMGMNFIGRYNAAMPVSPTPFIDSLPESFLNFWACSFPTNAGLATHYCSHPNYTLVVANRYPNSFVRQLADRGWRTALFRSADLSYSSGERRFSEIGFRELFGAEWQRTQGKAKYISGWGTCDRVSLLSAVEYLKTHRDERVFLSAMSADTHMPTGREDYGDLVYPEPPDWVKVHPQRKILTAISRFDHDLSVFFAALKAEGLWDASTLVVITADHAFPAMRGIETIPGVTLDLYQRIPFIVVSGGQPLPQVDRNRLATQTATAPTFAGLLGLPALPGWWGKNLFAHDYVAPVFVAKADSSIAVEPEIDARLGEEGSFEAARAMFHVLEVPKGTVPINPSALDQ